METVLAMTVTTTSPTATATAAAAATNLGFRARGPATTIRTAIMSSGTAVDVAVAQPGSLLGEKPHSQSLRRPI